MCRCETSNPGYLYSFPDLLGSGFGSGGGESGSRHQPVKSAE
jgi:hypothetical protein